MAGFLDGLQRAFGPTGEAAGDLVSQIKALLGREGAQDTFEAGGIEMGPEDMKQGVMPLDPSGALGRALQAAGRGGGGIQGVARLLKGSRELPRAGVREGMAHDVGGASREASQRLQDHRFFSVNKSGKPVSKTINPEDGGVMKVMDDSADTDYLFSRDRNGNLTPQSDFTPNAKQLDGIEQTREMAVKEFQQIDEMNARIAKRDLPDKFALNTDDDKLSLFEELGMEDLGKKADELRKKNLTR